MVSRPAWEVGVSLAYLLNFAHALPPNMSSGEVSVLTCIPTLGGC